MSMCSLVILSLKPDDLPKFIQNDAISPKPTSGGLKLQECYKINTMKWKYRLPIFAAILFFILSIPFLLGYPGPSIHENRYSIVWMFINCVGIGVVASTNIADLLTRLFSNTPSVYLANLIAMILMLLFYIIVFFLIGSAIDLIRTKKYRKTGEGFR